PAVIAGGSGGGAGGAAIPGVALTDTIKEADADGRVARTLDRARLRAIQTPQAFLYDGLLAAHRRASAVGRDDFTDDAALAEWAGMGGAGVWGGGGRPE